MGYAIDRAVRALSKGMLQRVGLAAALVHDPELLVLDEPMSGLDPVGRKKCATSSSRKAPRTHRLFSSHILSDVEMMCDRVCILRKGQVVVAGSLRELLGEGKRRSEVTLGGASDKLREALASMAQATRTVGDALVMGSGGRRQRARGAGAGAGGGGAGGRRDAQTGDAGGPLRAKGALTGCAAGSLPVVVAVRAARSEPCEHRRLVHEHRSLVHEHRSLVQRAPIARPRATVARPRAMDCSTTSNDCSTTSNDCSTTGTRHPRAGPCSPSHVDL